MILEIQNVSKTYAKGNTKALDDFSAVLTPGVYGFLGPNGSGKSTLMNIITDNIKKDSGAVLYNGEDTLKLGVHFRNILGFMPQQQGIYDDFTGRRFLWYMAALKGLERNAAKERIEELLTLVNLEEAASRKIGGYSGGMKQRILIAQALLNDPEILILDEPTAGLDPKERIRIRNFISEIAAKKIVLFATHVVSDIESIAKEVIIIKEGKRLYQDTTEKLLNQIDGKVFEVPVPPEQIDRLQTQCRVTNIMQTDGGFIARIVDTPPEWAHEKREVRPQLEDLYIYLFQEKE